MYTRSIQVSSQYKLQCVVPFSSCRQAAVVCTRKSRVSVASTGTSSTVSLSASEPAVSVGRDAGLEQVLELEVATPQTKWWEVDCPVNMINVASLQELVDAVEAEQDPSTGRLVVVNFFAPECYACKSLQPKLRQIAGNNPDVLFIKVNGLQGDLQQYCESMGITRIPYFHFYRANKRVAEFTANMRPEKLAMLRAEIAAHKQQAIKAADTPQYTALEA